MQGRNEIIDGFRGIAILSVMAFHYLVRWHAVTGVQFDAPSWVALGKFGVEVFFVISGVVITMTVVRSASAVEFAIRRFARLYPAFLIACSLTFALIQWSGPISGDPTIADYLANLTMMGREIGFEYVDGAYWSLAVEVKFYAFVFVSFWILKDRFWLGLCGIAVAGWMLGLLLPKVSVHLLIAPFFPLFLAGMALWLGRFERQIVPAVAVATVAAVLYTLNAGFFETDRVSLLAVHIFIVGVAGSMLLLLAYCPTLRMGPLAWLGRISYSLYLVHQTAGILLIREMKEIGAPDLAAVGVAAAVCIVVAYILFAVIEIPAQKWIIATYRSAIRKELQPV